MKLNSTFLPAPWLRVAIAVCAVGWGANQFTALLPMYRTDLHLSGPTAQATFACYVLGLVPGLLLGGPAADRHGRRAVLLPATGLSVLSGLVLIAGQLGIGWLFLGRLFAGIASGGAFSAGTAWLKELSEPVSTSVSSGQGARRATVAMTLGFGVGPLVAGAVAQWAPAPGPLAYLPHLALALAAIGLLLGTPDGRRQPSAARPDRRFTGVPIALRRAALPMAPWVFASVGVALAYLPGVIAPRLAGYPVLFSGAITLLCALTGVLVQPLARRLAAGGPARPLGVGLGLITVGLVLGAVAAALLSPLLVLVTAVLQGAGYGCCLVYGLSEVLRLAEPTQLGRLTALFQACCYLGFVVSYPLAALQALAPPPVLLLGMAALSLATLVRTWRPARDNNHQPVVSGTGPVRHGV
ncbi:MAG TPA: MFS transporter [Pseudonocardia sp.]|jgi:MFS family permease